MWAALIRHHGSQPLGITVARTHAIRKHGAVRHTPHEWLAIIVEEVGEAATELNDALLTNDPAEIERCMDAYRMELAQAAAMCTHALIDAMCDYPTGGVSMRCALEESGHDAHRSDQ